MNEDQIVAVQLIHDQIKRTSEYLKELYDHHQGIRPAVRDAARYLDSAAFLLEVAAEDSEVI